MDRETVFVFDKKTLSPPEFLTCGTQTIMDFFPPQFQPYLSLATVVLFIFCGFSLLTLFLTYLRFRDLKHESTRYRLLLQQEKEHNLSLQDRCSELQTNITRLETELANEQQNSKEKLAILEDAEKKLNLQFQALANRIFDEKSEKFGQVNRERVQSLLQPLQEQLRGFQKRVDDIQVNDIRERTSLKEEILHLRDLNQQINREATNLTRALRGDKKRQGNWGELVLERVLEKSGLRKDSEYSTQQSFRNQEHQLRKPDVILHLPDDKDIIIDSKVSLSAWEKYIVAEEEKEKSAYLAEHITNIRNHVKDLSTKDYSSLPGIITLDFVLLFIPIDSSFAVAADTDPNLFSDAYEQRIIIVTPTTLLATLQTIENLWRYEHQNRNAREIAERAGAIYDKLRGFLEDMDKVGKQLATCTTTYDSAMNKLARGKGNIISQAGRLTELGVKTKKKIPRSIRDLSDSGTPN